MELGRTAQRGPSQQAVDALLNRLLSRMTIRLFGADGRELESEGDCRRLLATSCAKTVNEDGTITISAKWSRPGFKAAPDNLVYSAGLYRGDVPLAHNKKRRPPARLSQLEADFTIDLSIESATADDTDQTEWTTPQ